MKRPCTGYLCKLMMSALLTGTGICSRAQTPSTPDTSLQNKGIVAGSQYNRSGFHQWMWGRHYRKEWATPVAIPSMQLDTAFGGLKPYEAGGGMQSKTLRLRTASGKEYVLRSIDKSFGKALPEIYRNTFVQNIINDQVSIGHPYASLTIPQMAMAAGIYHTNPVIRYVPKQAALGQFNEEFGDKLYLLEQRPDANWEEADNFGNSGKIISTTRLLDELIKDNDSKVEGDKYVRARLFDIFIGDWGRHEDQWRWALAERDGKKYYTAIPRDRDQVYTKFDGALLRVALSAAGLGHLQTFDGNIKDLAAYNFPARNLDRRMANEVPLEVWVNNAKELQQVLTDEVIETSIRQLPPEVYPISGVQIVMKLKARREQLVQFATEYYKFLAKEVDIPATKKQDHFEITRLNDTETKVSIYKIDGESTVSTPYYERTFRNDETQEIRVYGIAGNDTYKINGDVDNNIVIRIIGGKDKDVITDASRKATTHIYDDKDNDITSSRGTDLHLSKKDKIHDYKYDSYTYDKKGIKPVIFFSNFDRFYVGLGYQATKYGWRTEPFASQHGIYGRYSITQNAVSFGYQGIVTHAIGKWDLHLNADFDAIRWTNYFGIGNETIELPQTQNNFDFYRVRSRELYAGIGLNRKLGQASFIRFTPFYQATKIINDEGRFLDKSTVAGNGRPTSDEYNWDHYAGVSLSYLYADVDDEIIPTKGISFAATATHTRSLEGNRTINNITGALNFYVPLGNRLVLAVRNGGAALAGEPKFYQLNMIGGGQNLRGFRRDRFRGRSAFYNNNELQYLFDFKSRLFNGKAGPLAFYDMGRVWQPGENSNLWHSGYGGGIMIAPFNKFAASITYGISNENNVFHIRLMKAF
jgi:hypothetical protein